MIDYVRLFVRECANVGDDMLFSVQLVVDAYKDVWRRK